MYTEALLDRSIDGDPHQIEFAWLEISNRCNLRCGHCYARSGPYEPATGAMTVNDWCRVMDELRILGCNRIQLIGGEPTLHPAFHDILRGACERGFGFIEIYTNATRLSAELCALIKSCGAHVAFSFYSTAAGTHDKITGSNGSYDRTLSGIREAVRCGIPLRAGVIVTEHNRDEINDVTAFLGSLGVDNIHVDREREIGRAAPAGGGENQYGELCGRCGAGSVTIDATGQISPCVFSHFAPVGSVASGLESAVRSKALEQFRSKLSRTLETADCSPRCMPHDCSPADGGGPCFPSGCDPSMCNPISCPPRD